MLLMEISYKDGLVVKTARAGEKFTTLDGKERGLEERDLLICDEKHSVAIAGVMGDLNSEVTDQTKNLVIEAACFSPPVFVAPAKD